MIKIQSISNKKKRFQSFEFADTAYESEWYNIPPWKAKCVILLIQGGNKPLEITAGKFFIFNFKLFGSVRFVII